MQLIFVVVATFLLLACTELLWRKGHIQKEYARKIVHTGVGTFVAFWPFFLSWNQIRLISLAFVVVVVASMRLKIFKSIHSVERPTWGEVLFAISVGIVTFLTANKYVYAAAMLHMSLADGAAAVLGTRFKSYGYRVFGVYKSVLGTVAFFVVSLAILLWYIYATNLLPNHPYLFAVALIAAGLENAGWKGFDNLFVPVFVAVVLETLR